MSKLIKVKATLTILSLALLYTSVFASNNKALHKLVNPFIGASTSTSLAGSFHGLGKTFPGAATPFGMVQLSPNTITGGDNGSGYSDEHKTIEGFAFTQMSGVGWYGDLGNLLTMPTVGDLKVIAGKENGTISGYRSHYDKSSEAANAGYYSVLLTDYNIKVEASALPHSGMLRFVYPKNDQSRIQIDLARRVGGTSTKQYIEVIDSQTIRGWMFCPPEGGGWGNGDGQANYTVHFYAKLSKPMTEYGFWSADIKSNAVRKRNEVTSIEYLKNIEKATIIKDKKSLEGEHIGFYAEFETEDSEEVLFSAAISFVDMDGAKKNYEAEMTNKTFDQVRHEAETLWDEALSRLEVQGGTKDDKVIFYTSLYHTMIDPRNYTDVDGRYIGGDYKTHTTGDNFTKRVIFSGWDVFRSQFPLQTLINPRLVDDQLNSLITLAEESGKEYFERWEFLNAYSGCMVGNPAISVLADAHTKGINNYDTEKALKYAINSSLKFSNGDLGYIPNSVSETLEYAYADWCVAEFAKQIGRKDIHKEYLNKSKAYKNIFDKSVNWFRPRDKDGVWAEWGENARLRQDFGCVESNLYQQGWFVPHDMKGMVKIMGGRKAVLKDLTEFFDNAPESMLWNNYYNHPNEPVHFVPFLFNQLKAPWLTQKWTRLICKNAYQNKVEGLVGNEDVGQMSAWYVLASIGLHPSCPGDGRFEITSPVFDKVNIPLDNDYFEGESFVINAHNNSPENIYIQSVYLNGKKYNKSYIDFSEISKGNKLDIYMGNKPNKKWGLKR